MGSKGSGSKTQTTSSSTAPPPEVMQAYRDVLSRATNTANLPLQQYGGPLLAGFTPTQEQGFAGIQNAQGAANPYYQQANQYIQNSAQPLNVPQFSGDALQQYMSPYQQNVIDSTLANIRQNNAVEQNGLLGKAISGGAWGGDRAGVAAAELARGQGLNTNATLANLNNQNYSQALGQFNNQQQLALQQGQANSANQQNAASLSGSLGQSVQQSGLTDANALLQTGGLQQQMAQNAINIPYQQFMQQQGYPFDTTQYLANIALGLGGNMGSTTTQTSPKAQTSNGLSQVLGTGLGIAGLFFNQGGRVGYAGGGVPDVGSSFIPQQQMQSAGLQPSPIMPTQEEPKDMGIADIINAFGGVDFGGGDGGLDFGNMLFASKQGANPVGIARAAKGAYGLGFADGGDVASPFGEVKPTVSYSSVVPGTPLYSFDPMQASARGVTIPPRTPVAPAPSASANTSAASSVNKNMFLGPDNKVYDLSNYNPNSDVGDSGNGYSNPLRDTVSAAVNYFNRGNNEGISGLGFKPFGFSGGGIVGYAPGGVTGTDMSDLYSQYNPYDPNLQIAGSAGLVPQITSPVPVSSGMNQGQGLTPSPLQQDPRITGAAFGPPGSMGGTQQTGPQTPQGLPAAAATSDKWKDVDKGRALSVAGFSAAAGDSPNFLTNVAKGALAGIGDIDTQRKAKNDADKLTALIDKADNGAVDDRIAQAFVDQGLAKNKSEGYVLAAIAKKGQGAGLIGDAGEGAFDSIRKTKATEKKGENDAANEQVAKSSEDIVGLYNKIKDDSEATPSGFIPNAIADASNLAGVPTKGAIARGTFDADLNNLYLATIRSLKGTGRIMQAELDKIAESAPKATDSTQVKMAKAEAHMQYYRDRMKELGLDPDAAGSSSGQNYSQEDLEHTAKKYNLTVDEVKKKLNGN